MGWERAAACAKTQSRQSRDSVEGKEKWSSAAATEAGSRNGRKKVAEAGLVQILKERGATEVEGGFTFFF